MKTLDVTLIPQGKYYISQFDETDVMVDNQIEARTVNPEFAQLIAEAGTVANETGLTPRELLEQRNEMYELLKSMTIQFKSWAKQDEQTVGHRWAKSAASIMIQVKKSQL